MADTPPALAIPVPPCRDLAAARAFWARLGFAVAADHGDYLVLCGWGTEVHLRRAEPDALSPGASPARVYLRTPPVDAMAAGFGDGLIHPPAQRLDALSAVERTILLAFLKPFENAVEGGRRLFRSALATAEAADELLEGALHAIAGPPSTRWLSEAAP